ncbi:hypothetical protein KR009_008338 [Drosophila setifemur]|nr:hypothetical protein KR009_008338 [Drosophila setifemur]
MEMLSIIVILLFVLMLKTTCGFVVTVDAHETDCFYDHAEITDKMSISFEVMDGGFKDITVEISGPDDDRLHYSDKDSSGSFTFTAMKHGDFMLCFNNEFSTLTPKVVMFQFRVARDLAYYVNPKERKDDVIEQSLTQGLTNQLSARMGAIKMEQEYMHYRFRGHLEVNESVSFRFLVWSIFSPSLLLFMTFLEIIYLKRFFEVKQVV